MKTKPDLIIKEWNKENRSKLRHKSGIYAFYLDNDCLYVGASQNLVERVFLAFRPNRTHNRYLKIILLRYSEYFQAELKVFIFFYPAEELTRKEEFIKRITPKIQWWLKYRY